MSSNICTGDYVWLHAGTTSRRGIVQGISTNPLGQTVFTIDGQLYSDPVLERSFRLGDAVLLSSEPGELSKVGRVLGVRPYAGSFCSYDLTVSLEVWDGSIRDWVAHAPVHSGELVRGSFREVVPVGRSLVFQAMRSRSRE